MRNLLTQSLAVLMPFNVQELNDSTGNYYGINQISKNVDVYKRQVCYTRRYFRNCTIRQTLIVVEGCQSM